MIFLPWHFTVAYFSDLLFGDPSWWPHPVRWIGRLIKWMEGIFYDPVSSPSVQRLAGCAFWTAVVAVVVSGTLFIIGLFSHLHPVLGDFIVIWFAYTTLATRSLHKESSKVARALGEGNLDLARKRLAWIVSRDTSQLEEKDIVRALIETVSENISDGIISPLFYLSIGGPLWGMAYKAVNTMDSMVGYVNERYRYFGWFAARMDDFLNLIPARLSGLMLIAAAACLKLNWRGAWRIMRRDARKMKSPNAGYPEAAAAGALGIRIGGENIYFGRVVEKPTLGDPENPLTLDAYKAMVRLMYVASLLAFALALGIRYLLYLIY
jgi:adenosylcobinamide-phosphate synthase